MPSITETDVLIAGAGPAGLITALCLTRLGIRVKIIEQRIPGEVAGQADGIQSRTLEILDSLGMGEKFRQLGKTVYQLATYNPNERQTGIKPVNKVVNVPLPSARYQYELILNPIQIEEAMTDALSDANVHIEQPCVLSDLEALTEDAEYPIKVQCVHFDKERLAASGIPSNARGKAASDASLVDYVETIYARYLIGCDGAHSWVRRQCGITMEGTSPRLTYGVIDFTPVTDFPTCDGKNIIQSPSAGALGYIPKPNGTARLYILLKDPAFVADLDKSSAGERAGKISQMVSTAFAPYDMRVEDVTWCNTYKVAQRVASRFSHEGRIFITGDACHTHSPNAGQGLNVSMVDAYNLSWKLAHVIRGRASKALLDTYELERRPYSLELIEFDKGIEKLFSPDGISPDEYAGLWHRQLLFVTGLGLQYTSPLTVPGRFQDLIPGAPIGQRFPPATLLRHADWAPRNTLDIIGYSPAFKLVVFAGNTAQPPARQACADFLAELAVGAPRGAALRVSVVLRVRKEEADVGWLKAEGGCSVDICAYIDDGIAPEHQPGHVHEAFGVSFEMGAVVLVRPDGHVAMVVPLLADKVYLLEEYLAAL